MSPIWQRQTAASPVPLTRSSRLQREVETIVARTTGSRGPADTGVSVRQGLVVPEILIIEGSSTARQLAHTAPVSVLAIPL